jgi:hypothetical protein
MPETCNCGAQLVESALFCHKCGRPLREIPEPETTGAIPVMKIEPVYPPVNFHNPIAVRVSLLMALAATLVFFLPLLNWIAAGFFAALLYRRRTGYLLKLEAGLRLGWITGVLMFAINLVMLTLCWLTINAVGVDALLDAMPPMLKTIYGSFFSRSILALQNVSLVTQIVFTNLISIILASMAGGVLGARLSRRDSEDPAS